MAGSLTASLALSNSTVTANQKTPICTVTCTVSNAAATAVNVSAIEPYVTAASNQHSDTASIGRPFTGPGATVSVPASGTLNFFWDVIPQGPQVGGQGTSTTGGGGQSTLSLVNPVSQVLTLGAWVTGADGSYVQATTAALTVNAPQHFRSLPASANGEQ